MTDPKSSTQEEADVAILEALIEITYDTMSDPDSSPDEVADAYDRHIEYIDELAALKAAMAARK
jgi:hypothetical protein